MKSYCSRWAVFQTTKAKVEAIKDFKEEEYQDGFLKDILNLVLDTLKTTTKLFLIFERKEKRNRQSR